MSSLKCICGHVIRDSTNGLSYKAAFLKDVLNERFFDWIASETQDYVVAAKNNADRTWLLEHEYGQEYVDLQLDHGNVVHDHIHSQFLQKKRDMYECQNCGRLHIETSDNQFVSFSPDNAKVNQIFREDDSNGI